MQRQSLGGTIASYVVFPFYVVGGGALSLMEALGRLAQAPKEWTPWFAWRPVMDDNGGWAWLERVERVRGKYGTDYRRGGHS